MDGAGSSPLARGLPACRIGAASCGRIIPARAGFTGTLARRSPRHADHPRSRGVYQLNAMKAANYDGSSPLARGLHSLHVLGREPLRIIPARAGFTPSCFSTPCTEKDHPRSRGVYERPLPYGQPRVGSSPLARGLLRDSYKKLPMKGIIPARAGFTTATSRSRWSSRDHPRSRGVYTWRSLESQRPPTLPDGFRLHC